MKGKMLTNPAPKINKLTGKLIATFEPSFGPFKWPLPKITEECDI